MIYNNLLQFAVRFGTTSTNAHKYTHTISTKDSVTLYVPLTSQPTALPKCDLAKKCSRLQNKKYDQTEPVDLTLSAHDLARVFKKQKVEDFFR